MSRRYEDERETGESQQHGGVRHGYRGGEGPGPGRGESDRGEYGRPYLGRREEQGYRGPGGGYGGGWGWPRRHREGPYGRGVYGEDQYGWTEYGEPRYAGSLYRGELRGGEPYREHEWQRSKEPPPALLARLYARGPKGYTRSDERIKEDISERLWRTEYLDSSEVSVAVKDGVVTFSGTVPVRWMRHEIENIADSCIGVQDIENNIRVQRRTIEEANVERSGTRGAAVGVSSSTTMGAAPDRSR